MFARCMLLAALSGEGFFLVESSKLVKRVSEVGETSTPTYDGVALYNPGTRKTCTAHPGTNDDITSLQECYDAIQVLAAAGLLGTSTNNKQLRPSSAPDSSLPNLPTLGSSGTGTNPYWSLDTTWEATDTGPKGCSHDSTGGVPPNYFYDDSDEQSYTGGPPNWFAPICKCVVADDASNPTDCQTTGASATGDPHLRNIHGKKFDVHDGMHRLVHIPQGAPDSEALLIIDADATMMPGEMSCYNVYFTSARISGKWVGSDVLFRHDDAPMGKKRFQFGVGGKFYDWSHLKRNGSYLKFSGIEPVKVSTKLRKASVDAPGGEDLELSIGQEHPVQVQVWASKGSNELSEAVDIQFLNLEVRNLPENTGGLLGLDTYNRPAGSKCGLTTQDTGAIQSIGDLLLLDMKHTRRLHWRISAQVLK